MWILTKNTGKKQSKRSAPCQLDPAARPSTVGSGLCEALLKRSTTSASTPSITATKLRAVKTPQMSGTDSGLFVLDSSQSLGGMPDLEFQSGMLLIFQMLVLLLLRMLYCIHILY